MIWYKYSRTCYYLSSNKVWYWYWWRGGGREEETMVKRLVLLPSNTYRWQIGVSDCSTGRLAHCIECRQHYNLTHVKPAIRPFKFYSLDDETLPWPQTTPDDKIKLGFSIFFYFRTHFRPHFGLISFIWGVFYHMLNFLLLFARFPMEIFTAKSFVIQRI